MQTKGVGGSERSSMLQNTIFNKLLVHMHFTINGVGHGAEKN